MCLLIKLVQVNTGAGLIRPRCKSITSWSHFHVRFRLCSGITQASENRWEGNRSLARSLAFFLPFFPSTGFVYLFTKQRTLGSAIISELKGRYWSLAGFVVVFFPRSGKMNHARTLVTRHKGKRKKKNVKIGTLKMTEFATRK